MFSLTGGVREPEGDRLVFDAAHVTDGHLAGVVGEVLRSQVLQLQHLGLTLTGTKQHVVRYSFF